MVVVKGRKGWPSSFVIDHKAKALDPVVTRGDGARHQVRIKAIYP
jgi:hypothetical protein